jgi:hypothetical protein
VATTRVDFLSVTLKSFKEGGRVDDAFPYMPKYLDYRLRQVSELRQVTIWTARSWRDSGSKKWHEALAAVERENEKRKAKNLPQLGCFH